MTSVGIMFKTVLNLVNIVILLIVICFCGYCAAEKSSKQPLGNGKLVFSHVIFRHGDRMPVNPYPTDPWKDISNWPTGWGQLTNLGKQQHFELGQWLRKRYGAVLLNRTYSNNEIYVQSTDVDRTLMSALANLAGLYEPTEREMWNNNINWQPIPVHTTPEAMDVVLAAKAPCTAWSYELSQLLSSPEFKNLFDKYEYLFNYLSTYTGQKVNSLEHVQRINNTLFIESLYNKTLPEWTHKVFPSEDMSYLAALQFAVNTYTRKMARLHTGTLIKEMLQRFDMKARGQLKPDRGVWIYSAHDTTLASVLNTLKVFEIHSPPYVACILFELRLDENARPFVSLLYKNTTAEPYLLTIPGCGTSCPLSKMFKLYAEILPEDLNDECKMSPLLMTYAEANLNMATGMLAFIVGIFLLLSCILLCYFRNWSIRSIGSNYTYSESKDEMRKEIIKNDNLSKIGEEEDEMRLRKRQGVVAKH